MRKSSSTAGSTAAAGSSSSTTTTTTSRLPFRPRDVNTCSRAESVASLGSKASSGFSAGSGLSKTTTNNSSLATKYLNSYLESSHNPNNQRISQSTASASNINMLDPEQQQPGAVAATTAAAAAAADSSTAADTGGGIKIPLLSSSSKAKAAAAAASSATATAPKPKSSSSSGRQKPQVVPEDHEEIEIVEHRKKASGDGYTVHRYIRGRLLGKGGFAKCYLATCLQSQKQYAMKVVLKSTLTKPKAKQKLQVGWGGE